jgi:hypothetical protein
LIKALTVLGVAAVFVLTATTPAMADSARPTNYRSEVEGIEPPTPDAQAKVVGGDAFLDLTVQPGTEVVVLGYEAEPYLHIDDTGLVWVNTSSPAYYLNNDRYARVSVPSTAFPEAEPTWVQVGAGGRFGWHDHRTHWMAPEPPPGVNTTVEYEIQEWTVPILVDGAAASINGRLSWLPSVSPLPWLAIALIAFLVVLLTRGSTRGLALAVIVGAGAALLVGASQAANSPLGWDGEVLVWVPPAIALGLGLAALRRDSSALVAVASVLIVAWALLRMSTLWMPILPSELPADVERSAVAIALGSGTAVACGVVIALLRPPPHAASGP